MKATLSAGAFDDPIQYNKQQYPPRKIEQHILLQPRRHYFNIPSIVLVK